MPLLFAGPKGSKLASFAKQYATKYLKTSMEVLNESSFPKLLPIMSETTPVLISNGFNLGKQHENFMETIRERNMTLFFKDCEMDAMKGYVAVAAKGQYVVVHNACKGRKQQVIVIDEATLEAGSPKVIKRTREEGDIEHYSQQQMAMRPPDVDDSGKMVSKPSAKAPADPEATPKALTSWLKDDRHLRMCQLNNTQTYYWEFDTTLVTNNVSANPAIPSGAPSWAKNGTVKAFCAISILMYATKTPLRKWIEFKLTDAVGMSVTMGSDSDSARGHFNNSGDIYIFPGTGTDPQKSQLPTGWIRPHLEPNTPNAQTKYIDTTGWSVGVAGGGNPDGPKADVTASYSESNQMHKTINDFSVRNVSDGSMSGWNFYYTAMAGDGWAHHDTYHAFKGYEVDSIANLAKSTLTLNAEAVYQGPPGSNESLRWNVYYKPEYALLWSHGNVVEKDMTKYSCWWNLRNYMSLDMSKVRNPE